MAELYPARVAFVCGARKTTFACSFSNGSTGWPTALTAQGLRAGERPRADSCVGSRVARSLRARCEITRPHRVADEHALDAREVADILADGEPAGLIYDAGAAHTLPTRLRSPAALCERRRR